MAIVTRQPFISFVDLHAFAQRWFDDALKVLPEKETTELREVIIAFLLWNRRTDIDRFQLQSYINFLTLSKSQVSVKSTMKCLKRLFATVDPPGLADRLKLMVNTQHRQLHAMTEQQFRQVRDHLNTHGYDTQDFYLLCTILWYTGLAKGDACNLDWKQVDMEKLVISGQRRKTGSSYYIPFVRDGELHKALLEKAAEDGREGWVSHRSHLRMLDRPGRKGIVKKFREACQAAGMPLGSGPHSFRRAFITRLLTNGVADHLVVKMSGHRDTKMLDTYYKPTHEDLTKAIATLD